MKLRDVDKRTWSKLLAVVSAFVVFRLALQAALPPSIGSTVSPSVIVQAGFIVPVIALLFFSAYMLMGITYVLLQDRLAGTGASKGLRIGLAFTLMWGAYLLEPVGVSVVAYSETIKTAVVDIVPIMLLGIALGSLLPRIASSRENRSGTRIHHIMVIPGAFIIVRLIEYVSLRIYSEFSTMPIATLMWAVGTGLCIANMYFLIRDAVPTRSPMKRACFFGLGVFATNLLVFNMFMPAIMKFTAWEIGMLSYADLATRTMIDTAAVIIGVLIFERFKLAAIPREVSGRSTEG